MLPQIMQIGHSLPQTRISQRGRGFTAKSYCGAIFQKWTPVGPWNTDGVPGGAKPWAGGAVTTGAAGAGRGFGMLFTLGLGRLGPG